MELHDANVSNAWWNQGLTIADCLQQWDAYEYWQQYQISRNQWAAYYDWWQWYTSMEREVWAPIATTRSTDDEYDILRLREMKEETKRLVSDQLEVVLAMSKDAERELKRCIERVEFWAKPRHIEDATLVDVKDALKYAENAVGMSLDRAPELHNKLDLLTKNIRDLFSLRVQLAAGPVHDKEAYHKVLKLVYGGSLDDEEKARLMISRWKIICGNFPNAFNSNNKIDNLNRGGTRPRRERIPKKGCRKTKPTQDKQRSFSAPPSIGLQDVHIVRAPPGLENVTVKNIDEKGKIIDVKVENIDDTVKNIHETVTSIRAPRGVANKMSRTFAFALRQCCR